MIRSRFSEAVALVCALAGGACSSGSDSVAPFCLSCGEQPGSNEDGCDPLTADAAAAPRRGWPVAGFDAEATGHNATERRLRAGNVDRLAVEWTFDSASAGRTVRAIHASPVVDRNGNTFVGDFAGTFFAIDARGALSWAFSADPPTPELGALFPPELGAPTS